ncbi:Y-family DNA polymerase [Candidatus Saccharibacteria bacterium]|nr:Y-family DNA polymerase [Candidatus Saccharibacteria bacterium]
MKAPIFALVDCDNFFVSCERIFRPDLTDHPVVVLSSNDGCAVSRSNEAKKLGIPMGAPAFKYQELFKQHQVAKFSANFELYGNISRRITELLTTVTPRIEIYSVDESFLDLSELPIADYAVWGHSVRAAILQWTGVPVSIGIASSKTLAKLASNRAKKLPELGGVLNLINNPDTDMYLESVAVQDIWGIGRQLAPKLRAEGIDNALKLSKMYPKLAKQLTGIRGRQTVTELDGISCFPITLGSQRPKTILRSRTFGEDTNSSHIVESALASFATTAAFRLRRSGQLAKQIGIFVDTNRFKPGFRRWTKNMSYRTPIADTGQLINDAVSMFGEIYNTGVAYHRAGVWLQDFVPDDQLQIDIFGNTNIHEHDTSQKRMQAIDSLNERYGKHTVHYATQDLARQWQPKRKLCSPRYTTDLNELPKAKIVHTTNK